ncbi:MAG TPA: FHA domain-containing protein [Gammaproteobacteria bacterium]
MEGNSSGRQTDLDSTDRLPTLSEDTLVELDRIRTSNGLDDTAALEQSLAQLREALGDETERSCQLETRLDNQEQAIARLQADFEREAQQNSAARTSAETATSQAQATRALVGKVQIALRSLHARIASLETYIAGRPEGWREMEQALHSKSIRVAEAEAQLAEKITLLAQELAADAGNPEPDLDLPDADAPKTDLPDADAPKTDPPASEAHDVEAHGTQVHPANMLTGDDTLLEPLPSADVTSTLREALTESAPESSDHDEPEIAAAAGSSALVGGTPDTPIAYSIDKDSITIGRDPAADITIPIESVSRIHAIVTREGNEMIIEDHASTNGVFVNAVRVQRKALANGDEVLLGDSQFRYFGGEVHD